MSGRNWRELFEGQWAKKNFACVGLDPDYGKIPIHLKSETYNQTKAGNTILAFNEAIIEATADVAGIYKPQSAFYEAHGAAGIRALKETVDFIHEVAPDVPVILDAKRLDIGNTNNGYITSIFDWMQFDAVTLHNYLGREAAQPFLDRKSKLCIFMCKTSNPGAGEFQDLLVPPYAEPAETLDELLAPKDTQCIPLYQRVAFNISRGWNANRNCGLVVGATYPKELAEVRAIVGDDFPLLIPGIGTQGGPLEEAVQAGIDRNHSGIIVNSSSGIIHASQGMDFAEVARIKAIELRDGIRAALATYAKNNAPVDSD